MRRIVLIGLLCALAAVSTPAQMVVQGGAISSRIPAGSTIWYGPAVPATSIGGNGDFYVNTATYCLYGPKINGAWPATCTSSTQQLGYVAENVGNRGSAGGYAPLDSSGHVPAANLPPATSINGTSIPSNNLPDQTMITTAPSVGSWAALPACPDTGGSHLNYSVTTHTFLCGNTGGAASSVGFGAVSGGTNSGSLLIGGNLGYTGAGQVNANQLGGVSLASLSTGLLKITSGTGTPSTAAPSDVTATLGFTPENASKKGSANGYAPLDTNALVPLTNLPSITAVNGTSVPSNNASDQVVVTTAPASGAWTALPSCPDSSGSHLNYSVATHTFVCGSTSANVGFAGLGGGTNVNTLLVGGSLNYSGGGQINANQLGGVTLAGLGTGLVKNTNGTGAPSIAGASDVTTTLGYTPENTANRNTANGYAPLDANGLLPATNLPASAVTTSTLGNATLAANVTTLASTGDVNSGGNVNATGNVFANSTSAAAGCLHLSDANGVHDMGICAPSSGFNGLVNLMAAAGTSGQAITSDGANDLVWSNVANSVFGRTGAVTAQSGDYSFPQISGGVASTQLPNTTFMTMLYGSFAGATVAASTTTYGGVGQSSFATTETARSVSVPFACTLRNFHITTTSSQPSGAGGTMVINVRVAGANSGVTVTVNPGDAAQGYSDQTHSAAITGNQSVDIQFVNSNTSTSAAVGTWSIGCMPN